MSLPAETRRQIMISHEGQILSHVGSSGISMTGDLARCYLDGAINALIRLEGAEAATHFAFALSDRAAGGLRGETAIVLAAVNEDAIDEEDEDEGAAAVERPPTAHTGPDIPLWFFCWAVTIACFAGCIVGRGWPT